MGMWADLKRWWNGAEPEPTETEAGIPLKGNRFVLRAYQQFRSAKVAGDPDGIIRSRAKIKQLGYPVPDTLNEADYWLAKYRKR
jgi:hypothetical protein